LKEKKVFMGLKRPYGMKYEKLIRVVIRPIRNENSFKRTRASRGREKCVNERKKVFNGCFTK